MKKIFCVLFAVVILLGTFSYVEDSVKEIGAASGNWSDDTLEPTQSGGVYQIRKGAELAWIAKQVNAGESFSGKTFKLQNAIDLSAHNWVPVGGNGSTNAFGGTFDGNRQTIQGLTITSLKSDESGLFGIIAAGGTVKNLTITGNIDVAAGGQGTIGAVAGMNYGTIDGCINKASVLATWHRIGGIVGSSEGGLVINCGNEGEIAGYEAVGGICGQMDGGAKTVNCYNIGNLAEGDPGEGSQMGGIVGWSDKDEEIINCYSNALISCEEGEEIGGVTGDSAGSTVKDCYWNQERISNGIGNGDSSSVTGMKLKEMQTQEFANILTENAQNYNQTQPEIKAVAWAPLINGTPIFENEQTEPTYELTIPSTIEMKNLKRKSESEADRIATKLFDVTMSNLFVPSGQKLTVTVSPSEGSSFQMKNQYGKVLPYDIFNQKSGGTALPVGGTFMVCDENDNQSKTKTVTGRTQVDQSKITAAGEFSQTVIFEVK